MIYIRIQQANNGKWKTRFKKVCVSVDIYKEDTTPESIISLSMKYYDRTTRKIENEVEIYNTSCEILYITSYK